MLDYNSISRVTRALFAESSLIKLNCSKSDIRSYFHTTAARQNRRPKSSGFPQILNRLIENEKPNASHGQSASLFAFLPVGNTNAFDERNSRRTLHCKRPGTNEIKSPFESAIRFCSIRRSGIYFFRVSVRVLPFGRYIASCPLLHVRTINICQVFAAPTVPRVYVV